MAIESIYHADRVISKDTCESLIALFEASTKTVRSAAYAGFRGAEEKHQVQFEATQDRRGTVFIPTSEAGFSELDGELRRGCEKMVSEYSQLHPGFASLASSGVSMTNTRLERIDIGGGFDWHMDTRHVEGDRRFMTVLFYLNDVALGGETEFLSEGTKVKAIAGRVVFIPPFWTHVHRGCPPASGPKYTASFGLTPS